MAQKTRDLARLARNIFGLQPSSILIRVLFQSLGDQVFPPQPSRETAVSSPENNRFSTFGRGENARSPRQSRVASQISCFLRYSCPDVDLSLLGHLQGRSLDRIAIPKTRRSSFLTTAKNRETAVFTAENSRFSISGRGGNARSPSCWNRTRMSMFDV